MEIPDTTIGVSATFAYLLQNFRIQSYQRLASFQNNAYLKRKSKVRGLVVQKCFVCESCQSPGPCSCGSRVTLMRRASWP